MIKTQGNPNIINIIAAAKNRISRYDEPLRENCIVFESFWGRSYSCNPAAMYEYISQEHPEYECVWFFNDINTFVPGNAKKVKRRSEEYYHYLMTAKYFIYNTNMPRSFKKRYGQVVIHTMHGTPFKSFGLDVKEEADTEEKRIRIVERASIWDYLIAQGEFTKSMTWRWFRYDRNILETGYPRTDVLFRKDAKSVEEIRTSLALPKGKKVILYAPTWRKEGRFDMMLDIEEMQKALSGEYLLLIRLHHFVADYYEVPEDGTFVFDASGDIKVEDLYMITDVLVTDYSSVMFDFALTGKQMIFFAYDFEEYTKKDRGGYFDIATEAPGTLTYTTGEVIDAILHSDECLNADRKRIETFRNKYLTYENSDSAKKIFETVFVNDLAAKRILSKEMILEAARRIVPEKLIKRMRDISAKHRLSK